MDKRDRGSYHVPPAASTAVRRRHTSIGFDNDNDNDEDGGYKRQRTSLACNSCRHRKSRCNGGRPVCATCKDMGFECLYRRPAPAPKPQVRDMDHRLQRVEEFLGSLVGQRGTLPKDLDLTSLGQHGPGIDPAVRNTGEPMAASPHVEYHHQFQPEAGMLKVEPMCPDDTVDGMGFITFADESTSSYFGPTSNSSFFSHITRALLSTTNGTTAKGNESSRDLAPTMSRPTSPPLPAALPNPKPINPYILPPRATTVYLVHAYFETTGMFFPYVSKRTVLQMVEDLDTIRFKGIRKSSLCLLNAILAIGTSLDGATRRSHKARDAESDVYFQRAMILLPWTGSNTASLETLQALGVMTQYLQGSSRSTQTWRLHGMFVHAALQAGIHNQYPPGKFSALEQEIRTRTWYTCFILDQVHGGVFGRPPLIHNELVQIEPPHDVELDDILDGDSLSPPSTPGGTGPKPSSTGLFLASINLYRHQGDIIREIYNQNVVSSKTLRLDELLGRILRLDHDLSQWKRQLRPALSLVPANDLRDKQPQEWTCSRSQTVLTVRYLSVRLLLHRKILEHALDGIPDSTTMAAPGSESFECESSTEMIHSMLQVCTHSAVNVIGIIRKLGERPDLLPAWWFSAYHGEILSSSAAPLPIVPPPGADDPLTVFNAGLIVFGLICMMTVGRTTLNDQTPERLVQCLGDALEALDLVGKETRIFRRCSKYLKRLIQISASLVRNHHHTAGSGHGHGPDGTYNLDANATTNGVEDGQGQLFPAGGGSYENPPTSSTTTHYESMQSLSLPDAEFSHFFVEDDLNFLNWWTDLTQQPS